MASHIARTRLAASSWGISIPTKPAMPHIPYAFLVGAAPRASGDRQLQVSPSFDINPESAVERLQVEQSIAVAAGHIDWPARNGGRKSRGEADQVVRRV